VDSPLLLLAATFALFLLFATAEAASQLLSKIKVQRILEAKRRVSALNRGLLPERAGRLRSSLTYGRMLCVAAMAFALWTLIGQPLPVFLAAAAAAVLGSIYLPTLLAAQNPQRALGLLLPVVRFGNIVLLPLVWPRNVLFERFRSKRRQRGGEPEEEEAGQIEAYLDAAKEEGLFEPDQAEMVRQLVDFGDTVVREVMTPRVDMVCVERGATLEKLTRLAAEQKFSRFPVIDVKIDNVVGIAHIKDLLGSVGGDSGKKSAADIMAPPFFVPETKRVSSLLRDFQSNKLQMAIVVDEYGGTAGLITLEDILEEIVGEIEDEHETEEEDEILSDSDGSLVVAGSVDVDEVEELLGARLDDEAYETVSGLALSHLKRIPLVGEKFVTGGVEFEILDADEKSILRLRLRKTGGDA